MLSKIQTKKEKYFVTDLSVKFFKIHNKEENNGYPELGVHVEKSGNGEI
jgi:hypothetical protein